MDRSKKYRGIGRQIIRITVLLICTFLICNTLFSQQGVNQIFAEQIVVKNAIVVLEFESFHLGEMEYVYKPLNSKIYLKGKKGGYLFFLDNHLNTSILRKYEYLETSIESLEISNTLDDSLCDSTESLFNSSAMNLKQSSDTWTLLFSDFYYRDNKDNLLIVFEFSGIVNKYYSDTDLSLTISESLDEGIKEIYVFKKKERIKSANKWYLRKKGFDKQELNFVRLLFDEF